MKKSEAEWFLYVLECESGDLVLHERDQGRDDHGHAISQQGRDLVAERLAAPRGHEHEGVAAFGHMLDHLRLVPAEGRIAENFVEYF